MLFSPDPRVTRPLTANLTGENEPPLVTIKVPNVIHEDAINRVPTSRTTSTKVPIVIPASSRRTRPLPLDVPPSHKRRFVLPGVLVGSILVALLASLFVVPLDNSQHPHTIFQALSNLFANAQANVLNTSLHAVTPTATAIPSGESGGLCRGIDIWSTCATFMTDSGLQGTGQMQHPIAGAVISQYFGHNEYQLWCGCWRPHTGIDLAAPYGTPIMAADTGQVIWVGWDWSGLGWAVKINHGNYIATIYGHMDHYIVKMGQNVSKGQVIGYEGSTGASTGPHLHFMVLVHNMWVNPLLYVQLP